MANPNDVGKSVFGQIGQASLNVQNFLEEKRRKDEEKKQKDLETERANERLALDQQVEDRNRITGLNSNILTSRQQYDTNVKYLDAETKAAADTYFEGYTQAYNQYTATGDRTALDAWQAQYQSGNIGSRVDGTPILLSQIPGQAAGSKSRVDYVEQLGQKLGTESADALRRIVDDPSQPIERRNEAAGILSGLLKGVVTVPDAVAFLATANVLTLTAAYSAYQKAGFTPGAAYVLRETFNYFAGRVAAKEVLSESETALFNRLAIDFKDPASRLSTFADKGAASVVATADRPGVENQSITANTTNTTAQTTKITTMLPAELASLEANTSLTIEQKTILKAQVTKLNQEMAQLDLLNPIAVSAALLNIQGMLADLEGKELTNSALYTGLLAQQDNLERQLATTDGFIAMTNDVNQTAAATARAEEELLPLKTDQARAGFLNMIAQQGAGGLAVLQGLRAKAVTAGNTGLVAQLDGYIKTASITADLFADESQARADMANRTSAEAEVALADIAKLAPIEREKKVAVVLADLALQGAGGVAAIQILENKGLITTEQAVFYKQRALQNEAAYQSGEKVRIATSKSQIAEAESKVRSMPISDAADRLDLLNQIADGGRPAISTIERLLNDKKITKTERDNLINRSNDAEDKRQAELDNPGVAKAQAQADRWADSAATQSQVSINGKNEVNKTKLNQILVNLRQNNKVLWEETAQRLGFSSEGLLKAIYGDASMKADVLAQSKEAARLEGKQTLSNIAVANQGILTSQAGIRQEDNRIGLQKDQLDKEATRLAAATKAENFKNTPLANSISSYNTALGAWNKMRLELTKMNGQISNAANTSIYNDSVEGAALKASSIINYDNLVIDLNAMRENLIELYRQITSTPAYSTAGSVRIPKPPPAANKFAVAGAEKPVTPTNNPLVPAVVSNPASSKLTAKFGINPPLKAKTEGVARGVKTKAGYAAMSADQKKAAMYTASLTLIAELMISPGSEEHLALVTFMLNI